MRVIGLLALLLCCSPLLLSQEGQPAGPTTPPAEKQQPSRTLLTWLEAPDIIYIDVKQSIIYLLGNVHVRVGDTILRCDNLVAWLAEGQQTPNKQKSKKEKPGTLSKARRYVRELYAEGHVVIQQGSALYRAHEAYLDALHDRGLMIDATVRLEDRSRSGPIPLIMRAQELRMLDKNHIQADQAQLTTSPFEDPSFKVSSNHVDINREPAETGTGAPGQKRNQDIRVHATGNALFLGPLPVLWFPNVSGDSREVNTFHYVKDLNLRHSNRFGYEADLVLGDDLTGADGKKWGSWEVLLDYLSKRGAGAGVDFQYHRKKMEGRFLGRFQKDQGRDRFFGRPKTENRGRISWWHRQRLPADIQLDLEFNLLSDRGFMPTFFEDDFKQDKPPENVIHVQKPFFNALLAATYTTRFNNFLTQTEYQPELRFDLISEPLLELGDTTTLYFSTSFRLGQARLKPDQALRIPNRRSFRADLDNLLEMPFLLGPFKLTPFAGLRYSFFGRKLTSRGSRDRVGFTHGATLSLQAWKSYEGQGGLFDLDGLRHVILPEITFRNTVGVDLAPSELIRFDDVESFDNSQEVKFRLRNLFQTLRRGHQETYLDTFLDVDSHISYFPNAARDNGGHPWSNLETDILVHFSENLQVASDFEYNSHGDGFQVFNISAGYTPSAAFQGFTGFRHFENSYDAVFVQLNWRPEEKWVASVESGYDFQSGRGIEHRIGLARISKDWVFQLELRADVGENDFGATISFSPRALFNPILSPRRVSHEPRFLFLGTGIQH